VVAVSSFRFALSSFVIVLRLLRVPRFKCTELFFFRCYESAQEFGRWRFSKELRETDVRLFFARLLHIEKLQQCVIFGDPSPENSWKVQRATGQGIADLQTPIGSIGFTF
jgi:hypothetical protein